VPQDTAYNEYYTFSDAKLDTSLGKSESEDAQLIITAKTAVKSFELKAGELKNGSVTFPADKVKIFVQKYIFCANNEKWSGYVDANTVIPPDTYYPDMLLPMNKSIEYGENKIPANTNQGITVSFYTDEATVPGVYTGNFTLTVDGKNYDVPVKVEVWDFSLAKINGVTYFFNGFSQDRLIKADFDNTDEYMVGLYNFALENKITPDYLPGHSMTRAGGGKAYAEKFLEYFDNPNFTLTSLPMYSHGSWNVMSESDKTIIKEYLLEIAKASTPEKNLFDKFVIFSTSLDEPFLQSHTEMQTRLPVYYEAFKAMKAETITALESEGFFSAGAWADATPGEVAAFKASITNIRMPLTSRYEDGLTYNGSAWSGDNINTYVPNIDFSYNTLAASVPYVEQVERGTSLERWFYSCNNPKFPQMNHFTESPVIATRALRWLQKKAGVNGYLYWAIMYAYTGSGSPYTDSNTVEVSNPPGDGLFFYPGRAYGSEIPFGSIRSHTFKDGQEDFDMLWLLETKYIAKAAEYGINAVTAKAKLDAMLTGIYDRLIHNTTYNMDVTALENARKEIASLILALDKGVLINYEIVGANAEVTVLSESPVTLNGVTAIDGGAGVYSDVVPLNLKVNTLSVKSGTVDVTVLLSRKVEVPVLFADALYVNSGSDVPVIDGDAVSFGIKTSTQSISGAFGFNLSLFDKAATFENIDRITFTLKNNSAEDLTINVSVSLDGNGKEIEVIPLKAGVTSEITLPLVYNSQFAHMSRMNRLLFKLSSRSGAKLNLTLSGLTYTVKGE
jgi:hypothetical protein